MREILFRGKRVDSGEWAYSRCPDATIMAGMLHWDFTPETVGQYTGLCDKNGKKIFEGDVVQFDYVKRATPTAKVKGRVFFEDETCAFSVEGFFIECTQFLCDLNEAEVIGNIYDNPELMEVNSDAE